MKLVPFSPHPLQAKGSLEGELALTDSQLSLEWTWPRSWQLHRVHREVKAPGLRAHELWRTTCFEAFVSAGASGSYFEINLAPDGRWNVYSFDRYREPQPPREAEGWILNQFECAPGWLRATLELPDGLILSPRRFGLTAVLETDTLSYWALAHTGSEPDFHDARSWF